MTFVKHYLLAFLVFNLAACSNLQVVNIENAMKHPPPHNVDYGSLVHVKMLDGSSATFRVTVMNTDGLGSNEKFYRYENMDTLKVEAVNNDSSQVWSIILGVLGAAALVYLVANADSVSVCSPAPCRNP